MNELEYNQIQYFRMNSGHWIVGTIITPDVTGDGEVFTISKPFIVDHVVGPNGELGMQMIPFCPGDQEAAVHIFKDAWSAIAEKVPDAIERRYLQLTTNIELPH